MAEAAKPDAKPEAAKPEARRSGNLVSVGCKLPNGLTIAFEKVETFKGEKGQTLYFATPTGESVTLAGSNSARVIGGYGITDGVDGDAMAAWLAANAQFAPVKRGLIFIQSSAARAEDHARDHAAIKNGFEAKDADHPAPGVEKVPN